MSMENKSLFAVVKNMLLAALRGERVNTGSLDNTLLSLEVAIDNAIIIGKPTNELESMREELLTIRKAVWYAHGGE